MNYLSQQSILAGSIEEAAERLAATRKAIDELKNRREEIADKFKANLLEITGAEVEHRLAKISSQLADQAIQLFEKSKEPHGCKRCKKSGWCGEKIWQTNNLGMSWSAQVELAASSL